jgi:hypothetical protein
MNTTKPAKTNHSPVYPRFWNALRFSPESGAAEAGTGRIPASPAVSVTQASYRSYGTRFTSEAALMAAVWPAGSPPRELTPFSPGCSEAWRSPSTVTVPEGGAGALSGSAAPGSHPRTTGSALPPSTRSIVST